MKINEYGERCFSQGEIIRVKGAYYKFTKIVPNKSSNCALYAEGIERYRGFCGSCGGCGEATPDGTVRGNFKLLQKVSCTTNISYIY